jgi:hypothetical protein
MGKKEEKPVTQTNTVKLSPEAQQINDLAFPFLQDYAQSTQTLPQPNIVGFNQNEQNAQQMALDAANGGMTQQMTNAAAANNMLMNPNFLSAGSNPYLSQYGDAIQQKMTQNLTESVLPALRSGSVVNGGFNAGGNTRYGIAQGKAVGETGDAIGSALSNLYNNAWNTNVGAMGDAIGRSGQVGTNLLKPATAVAAVGGQQRDMSQAQSDAAAQYDWLSQNMPYLKASQLYDIIGKMGGSQGVSTVQGAMPQSGGFGGAAGGALSGAASGAMMGSAIPGIGTAAGALGGGILGGLGGWWS